jgi:hypothetical protein
MFTGSCHCGKVKWSYPLAVESATACNCSLCSRYGALWIYGHVEDGITVSGETKAYERGRKINGFNFCTDCGCIVYYVCNSLNDQGQRRIAINLRTVDEPSAIMNLPIDRFEGNVSFEDLPRDGRLVHHLWF